MQMGPPPGARVSAIHRAAERGSPAQDLDRVAGGLAAHVAAARRFRQDALHRLQVSDPRPDVGEVG
jgi:hypothetical protein